MPTQRAVQCSMQRVSQLMHQTFYSILVFLLKSGTVVIQIVLGIFIVQKACFARATLAVRQIIREAELLCFRLQREFTSFVLGLKFHAKAKTAQILLSLFVHSRHSSNKLHELLAMHTLSSCYISQLITLTFLTFSSRTTVTANDVGKQSFAGTSLCDQR